MPSSGDWKIPPAAQPKAEGYKFDLDQALSAVVSLRAEVPADATTAETLGTERAGHGVVIGDRGLVLTIGYLITEAEAVWLRTIDGRVVPGHPLAFDHETGFGLVQALGRLDLPVLPLGKSADLLVGEHAILAAAGGRHRAVAARIVARQEFAGYWEYVLDDAIFTAPAHPNWGGTGLINAAGELVGIGSLHLEQRRDPDTVFHVNMIVPIDLLTPVLDDLLRHGRPNRPARPWLGVYVTELEDKLVVVGVAKDSPAQRADLRAGDVLLSVADDSVDTLAALFKRIWSLGAAGVEVPITVQRDGRMLALRVTSGDRQRFLRMPRMH
ncbi:signal protein PDZ [Rhodoplanes elegans]|uniref:Signal protein PDZ n=1 Tax=Rhodoplanes elegans TaxID=29408 RepID=A0A327JZY9_9BRAD|nr:S1C family serine protease [Rhodoplanes elegans]MBK5961527.1 signal protein PDZ [Rhodoplanes elegans]RAI31581.1 signal protein PDZ [Rhodoplanes elegans]